MPGLFEQFPHTNLHELNLDWIIDLLNQFKQELEDSAVLSVNGQTGHVTLYESENVILPALPEGVDQWRLVRMMDGQYAGILFYNGNVYVQRGNSTRRLLTQEDIPTSAGVVAWNGRTGVVNVTGMDIPVDDTADADSIYQAITTEHTERVNANNALQNDINVFKNNDLDAPVDLSGYTSGNYYSFPSDGYLRVYCPADSYIIYRLYGETGTRFIFNEIDTLQRQTVFIKKGMRFECRAQSGTIEIEFYGLV